MITFILIITIINTLILGHYVWNTAPFKIRIERRMTEYGKVCTGCDISLWKKTSEYGSSRLWGFVIPIKNHKKTNLQQEICFLISRSESDRKYRLRARFSWLKTQKEVEEFKIKYSDVDLKFVEKLVMEWKSKTYLERHTINIYEND